MKPTVAIVRGKFLNRYEMQFFEPLIDQFTITAFGSLNPYHHTFSFPVVRLPSPMDLPEFPYKMPLLNRLFTDAHYLWGLEQRLKGYDIVHTAETYYRYTQQCLNAKAKGNVKKVIATVLENIPFNNEGINGRTECKKRFRKEIDHIIALTERTKAALVLEGTDPNKITVISHFIDCKRFTPVKRAKPEIKLLYCGRLEKYKGVYDILYAMKLLLLDEDLADIIFTMTFVGDGSEKAEMMQLESDLGISDVITHTRVSYDQMPHIYNEADIYVAPTCGNDTWQEQYNTTLLEAQASGLPIVTTWNGGIPENVGDAALLVPPSDAYALAQSLKRFLLDDKLRDEYAKRARKRAETVHDIQIGANKLAALYHLVLS